MAATCPPLRVLCVDDNRDIADSTAHLLRVVGFEAVACYDGPSALLAARQFLPSICLLDLHMPGMNGDELGLKLREQAAGRPLVLAAVTAMSDDEGRARTAAAGFELHLVKPVALRDLLVVVDVLYRVWTAAFATSRA